MEGFAAYVRLVRKRGPEPYWTPVAPVHRLVSYFLSYTYVLLGLTPFAVTLFGLALALAGLATIALAPTSGLLWLGLALANLGVVHDACDGEVARYRLHHGLQSTATYRVGMFADFWAFAVLVQSLVPLALALRALRLGSPHAGLLVALAALACFVTLSAYVVAFARKAYWPGHGKGPAEASVSLAEGGPRLLHIARRGYFYAFETAMFTTHATLVTVAWALVGGTPWWAEAYVGAVAGFLALAFLVGHVQSFAAFDAEAG